MFITVVRKHRSMQRVINFLLTNVAVSDIISLVFLVLGFLLRFFKHPSRNLGNFLSKFVTTHRIVGISLLVSGLTLTIISVERHNALLRPMDSRLKLNRRSTKITVCFSWGISVAIVLPLFINERYVEELQTCFLDCDNAAARFKAVANEDTMLRTQMFPRFPLARNICCGHKFVSETQKCF